MRKVFTEGKRVGAKKDIAGTTTAKVGDGRKKQKQRLEFDAEKRRAIIHLIKKQANF